MSIGGTVTELTEIVPSDVIEVTPTGIIVKGELTFDLWESTLVSVLNFQKALPWIIGDLLNIGERKWGESYAQAVKITGFKIQTLYQYTSVAAAWPYEDRREGLYWSYHQITKSLPMSERKALLDKRESGELGTTDDVRDEVREIRTEPEQDVEEFPACPFCGGRLTKTKCRKCGKTFINLVWALHDLRGEVGGFLQTGEMGKMMRKIAKEIEDEGTDGTDQ